MSGAIGCRPPQQGHHPFATRRRPPAIGPWLTLAPPRRAPTPPKAAGPIVPASPSPPEPSTPLPRPIPATPPPGLGLLLFASTTPTQDGLLPWLQRPRWRRLGARLAPGGRPPAPRVGTSS